MRRPATLIVLGLAGVGALGLDACSGGDAVNTTTASATGDNGAASGNAASNTPQNSGAAPRGSPPPS